MQFQLQIFTAHDEAKHLKKESQESVSCTLGDFHWGEKQRGGEKFLDSDAERTRARRVGGDGGGKTQESSQQDRQKDKAVDGTWM